VKSLPAIIVAVAIAVSATAVVPAAGQDQDGQGARAGDVEAFVGALRRAIERRDRRAVAGLFHYPATASASGLRIPIESAASVIKMYDLLFTPAVRCAIVQRPATRAGTGLSIGNGSLWAQRVGSRYEITRVMVPPSAGAGSAARRKPVRIVFSANPEQPAQFSGALVRDEREAYVLSARKGQRLRARIDGFRGHDAELRLVAVPGGQPVDARDGVRVWDGIIPATGDYRLDVIRRAPYCDPVLVYALSVTLR
jgi:hypothetical protein